MRTMPTARARQLVTVATAVAVLVAGCAGGEDVTVPDDQPDPTPTQSSAAAGGAVPSTVLEEVVAQASERAGIAAEEVEVVRAEDVQWSSGALGCPEEGQMYTQVVTDGYWVVVQVGDEEFDFRAADDGQVRLCEGGGEPPMDAAGG